MFRVEKKQTARVNGTVFLSGYKSVALKELGRVCWILINMDSFALFLFKSDPTFIPHKLPQKTDLTE